MFSSANLIILIDSNLVFMFMSLNLIELLLSVLYHYCFPSCSSWQLTLGWLLISRALMSPCWKQGKSPGMLGTRLHCILFSLNLKFNPSLVVFMLSKNYSCSLLYTNVVIR